MHIDPALPLFAVFGANAPSEDELFAARLIGAAVNARGAVLLTGGDGSDPGTVKDAAIDAANRAASEDSPPTWMGVANTEDAGRPVWHGEVLGRRPARLGASPQFRGSVPVRGGGRPRSEQSRYGVRGPVLPVPRPPAGRHRRRVEGRRRRTPVARVRAEADQRAGRACPRCRPRNRRRLPVGRRPRCVGAGLAPPAESCRRRRPRGHPAHARQATLPTPGHRHHRRRAPVGCVRRIPSPSRAALFHESRRSDWPEVCYRRAGTRTSRRTQRWSPRVGLAIRPVAATPVSESSLSRGGLPRPKSRKDAPLKPG